MFDFVCTKVLKFHWFFEHDIENVDISVDVCQKCSVHTLAAAKVLEILRFFEHDIENVNISLDV